MVEKCSVVKALSMLESLYEDGDIIWQKPTILLM